MVQILSLARLFLRRRKGGFTLVWIKICFSIYSFCDANAHIHIYFYSQISAIVLLLLTFVGLLLPAANCILVVTVIREILAVIPVELAISVLLLILRRCPFESTGIIKRGL